MTPTRARVAVKKPKAPRSPRTFNLKAFVDGAGVASRVASYAKDDQVFAQGGVADAVMYLQRGAVKLSVPSRIGREAVVGLLAPGDFFGEGALAGQTRRIASATAMAASSVLVIEKQAMALMLREHEALSFRFIQSMLARNVRIEAELVEHLFRSSERAFRKIRSRR